MNSSESDAKYNEAETARRATAALRVALNTPPKPHKPIGKKAKSRGRKRAASAKPKTA
jgi:hypothetical protein